MTLPIEELKTQARMRQKTARAAGAALQLKEALALVARARGFMHFDHARRVLGGLAAPGDDMGSFWYAPRCSALLSEWFAREVEALEALASNPGAYLLPYRLQYVVVGADFVRELGLDPSHADWAEARRSLVGAYGSRAWQALALQRLRAPEGTFAAR
jgi:hypothetical protein